MKIKPVNGDAVANGAKDDGTSPSILYGRRLGSDPPLTRYTTIRRLNHKNLALGGLSHGHFDKGIVLEATGRSDSACYSSLAAKRMHCHSAHRGTFAQIEYIAGKNGPLTYFDLLKNA